MLRTLYAKLLAVLVGLTVIMGVMFVVVIRHSDVARNQEINQKLYRNLAQRLIDEQFLSERDSAEPASVQRVFDRIRIVNPRIDVYLLDRDGQVVAASVRDALKRDRVDLEPIRRIVDENAELPDPRRRSFGRVAPARVFGRAGAAAATARVISISCCAGSRGDTLVAAHQAELRAARDALADRLRARHRAARERADHHDHDAAAAPAHRRHGQVPRAAASPSTRARRCVRTSDEIGTLTETFNRMADRILDQMAALQKTDAMRREFVANISHDLRTPLASLQGYLETLHLKGSELPPEEQRAYLETALKQTEQLSGLVGAALRSRQARFRPGRGRSPSLSRSAISCRTSCRISSSPRRTRASRSRRRCARTCRSCSATSD